MKIVLILAGVIILAIMFDWFGSREIISSGLESTQSAFDKVQETGDGISESVERISNAQKGAE
ncbi:hypothetical protein GHNINEIG_00121 [Hydrogenovibrio crunogenus]|uniref:Uncharacterized protein n=1 Tax=Hydrogenovibrio crunogenus TaxID=39765 RepID=A0A4P7NWQ4_9GAMM|nr:hypothetical protein [Hydrogenovibrio crunogenus]QBZ82097.1 hypothetical protein GHNINEIG_00121 [Hydrogenovibrio crunogenus]